MNECHLWMDVTYEWVSLMNGCHLRMSLTCEWVSLMNIACVVNESWLHAPREQECFVLQYTPNTNGVHAQHTWYKFKFNIWSSSLNLYRRLSFFQYGEIRGFGIFSGICQCRSSSGLTFENIHAFSWMITINYTTSRCQQFWKISSLRKCTVWIDCRADFWEVSSMSIEERAYFWGY